MENKFFKKCALGVFIFLIFFSASTPILAAINETYDYHQQVEEEDLDEKFKSSVVMEAIASFIYSLASFGEYVVGGIFNIISGEEEFPWADRVLFNAVPLLDVNFFNPSQNSLFKTATAENENGQSTQLAFIVRNTYFTILTISIAFITVVIGIAAVKLSVTSIAAEKAKYKDAITKWVFSIVLLFLMHNVMSFVFWVNESMVKVASSMVGKALEDGQLKEIFEKLNQIGSDEKVVDNFISDQSDTNLFQDITNYVRVATLTVAIPYVIGDALVSVSAESIGQYLTQDETHTAVTAALLRNDNYVDYRIPGARGKDGFWGTAMKEYILGPAVKVFGIEALASVKADVEVILEETANSADQLGLLDYEAKHYAKGKNFDDFKIEHPIQDVVKTDEGLKKVMAAEVEYAKLILKLNKVHKHGEAVGDEQGDLIANMAKFFKKAAFTYETDDNGEAIGWRTNKISVTGAILYAIFVTQSIMFLFSYTKRFFYIVVLAIMAPAIVVVDFLGKALT